MIYAIRFTAVALSLVLLSGCGYGTNGRIGYQVAEAVKEDLGTESPLDLIADTDGMEPTVHRTVNNLDGVAMSVKYQVTNGEKLSVAFINSTPKHFAYGNDLILERKINGAWYAVPMVRGYIYTTIAYTLVAGDYREWTVDLSPTYGYLGTGRYRVLKGVLYSRGPRDNAHYYLAAEFFIKP